MKRALAILLAALLALGLAACGRDTKEEGTVFGQGSASLILVADFSCGSEEPNRKEYTWRYDDGGNGPAVMDMAAALSELTGLDFALLDVTAAGSTGMLVDWSPEGSLFGMGEREQKEEFFLFDYDSTVWFMLDSLYQTIVRNIPAMRTKDIFFTMDGGKELALENLAYPGTFTLDTPYMGSAFYFAHAGGRGDDIDAVG